MRLCWQAKQAKQAKVVKDLIGERLLLFKPLMEEEVWNGR